MEENEQKFDVEKLGECRVLSPISGLYFINEKRRVLYHDELEEIESFLAKGKELPTFEMAGPRQKIYFDPSKLKCGIVTCGGLCPGLNDVIRALVISLYYHYGVKTVFGFPYGYEGLVPKYHHKPVEFTPEMVSRIHELGGSILGSSRGAQNVEEMVDTLERMNIGILFTIGGDGTLRGAHAIWQEIQKRGLKISVIGIPKTIDNDISYTQMSLGFQTAVSEARRVTYAAHSEAEGHRNGIGLVKLMGRESGFIAAYASLADTQVNFCLIPEVPFKLEVFLKALRRRLENRGHAVIVVAEGAGQDLMEKSFDQDASGNIRLNDIGIFLREKIREYFSKIGMEINLKYIDPSYTIRSMPANAFDSSFCLLLGHHAVHAGMAGRSGMVVGYWKNTFIHLPIPLATSKRKKIDPEGFFWSSVLAATGQPKNLE